MVFHLHELFDHFRPVRVPVLHYAPKYSVHVGARCSSAAAPLADRVCQSFDRADRFCTTRRPFRAAAAPVDLSPRARGGTDAGRLDKSVRHARVRVMPRRQQVDVRFPFRSVDVRAARPRAKVRRKDQKQNCRSVQRRFAIDRPDSRQKNRPISVKKTTDRNLSISFSY